MDLNLATKTTLKGLTQINIILGKNGSGKSILLRDIEKSFKDNNDYEISYVTPERGGTLIYSAGIEQNASQNKDWANDVKRKNQWTQFKEYSITQFRKLELIGLRELEGNMDLRKDPSYSFNSVVDTINELLPNINIKRSESGGFDIFLRDSSTKLQPSQISSGESELISLAIECSVFEKMCKPEKINFLLLDEPDVHLHPDLQ